MVREKRRPLFREHALQQYMQRRENDILPQIVSPPVFLFAWVLLALVIGSGVVAWLERVPIYVDGPGVVVANEYSLYVSQSTVNALVFVPVRSSDGVRVGGHALTRFGLSGQYFESTVIRLEPMVLSPRAIQVQYGLACSAGQEIHEPSVVVHMQVAIPAGAHIYDGMPLQARIHTGSQRVLGLIPVFSGWIGGS